MRHIVVSYPPQVQYTAEGGAAAAPPGGTHTQEGENMVRQLAGNPLDPCYPFLYLKIIIFCSVFSRCYQVEYTAEGGAVGAP